MITLCRWAQVRGGHVRFLISCYWSLFSRKQGSKFRQKSWPSQATTGHCPVIINDRTKCRASFSQEGRKREICFGRPYCNSSFYWSLNFKWPFRSHTTMAWLRSQWRSPVSLAVPSAIWYSTMALTSTIYTSLTTSVGKIFPSIFTIVREKYMLKSSLELLKWRGIIRWTLNWNDFIDMNYCSTLTRIILS